jgi:hypothetical protein
MFQAGALHEGEHGTRLLNMQEKIAAEDARAAYNKL